MKPTILYLDDDWIHLTDFKENFKNDYNIFLVDSTIEAYKVLKHNSVNVIIADQNLSNETGVEFFERVRNEFTKPYRILITGFSGLNIVIDAINKGQIYHYFKKPWIEEEVRMVIDNLMKNEELKRQLLEKESQFESLFEQAAVGLARLNINFQLIDVNKKFCEFTGYSKKRMLEMTIEEIIHPDDQEMGSLNKHKIIVGVIPHYQTEKRIIRNDGVVIWGRVTISVAVNDSGMPGYLICVLEEITDKKRSEQEVAKYREHLEEIVKSRTSELRKFLQVVEQSPISVIITDTEGLIEFVNPKFTENTGYSVDEVFHKKPNILKSGHHSVDFYNVLWKTIKKGNIWQGEIANKKRNGDIFWESTKIFSIKDDQNKIKHFVTVKEDITEKKRIEVAVEERVALLDMNRRAMLNMMEDLSEAKKGAEAATQAKSAFLANMSHEIRTPMNSVLGFLSLVLDDPELGTEHHKNLMTAYSSARDLLGLINNILDISKLESGKIELEKVPFFLPKLMHETLQTLNIIAKEKGLRLDLKIEPAIPLNVIGDSARLKQILINLIGNAIKFTEKGSVQVLLKPWSDKNFIHFSINDTGIGINDTRLKKIFEPFTQADSSTSRRFGGTGLGTTISRQLVELMDGEIWVDSELNKGSSFQFTIQLIETEKDSPDIDNFAWTTKSQPDWTFRRFRILMVEDIETNRTLGKIRLENQGHTLLFAHNGLEALEIYQQEEIDLILMDIQMPEMDGIEATRRIRELEVISEKYVPIIALTASIMKEDIDLCKEAGMDDVAGKPIDFNQLYLIMEKTVPEGVGQLATPEDIEIEPFTVEAKIPPLVGINVEKGLAVWKESKVYIKNLMDFADNYQSKAADISGFIDVGDIDSAIKTAHALKGVAGSLFLGEVMDISRKLDNELRKDRLADAMQLLPNLTVAIRAVIEQIKTLKRKEETVEFPKKEMDQPRLKEIITSMLIAFEQYNPDVMVPYLDDLKEFLTEKQIRSIIKHIEGFNFDAAKYETIELAKKIAIKI